MTAVPSEHYEPVPIYPGLMPGYEFSLIQGEGMALQEGEASRNLFDTYFELRDEAIATPKVEGEALQDIQAAAAVHLESTGLLLMSEALEDRVATYTGFGREAAYKKITGLVDFLAENHATSISAVELEATRAFLDSAYAMYNDRPEKGEVMADADGSFAFVVPARMGRKHPDYGQEVEPVIPALRYVPNELRAALMAGLPPFVIDTYQKNEDGRRGYLILAPVFEDMKEDLGGNGALLKAARQNVNAAVDFAYRRFGTEVVGLGATLPALTLFGKKVTNPNVVTTTGHAGTVDLINTTVESAVQDREVRRIGVLGLGSIGEAIARNMTEQYPDAEIVVYEADASRAAKILEQNPSLTWLGSEKEVLESSDVTISAITSRLDLKAIGVTNMEGRIVVDDSQPGSIDPEQLQSLGGDLLWVIGTDPTGATVQRRGYDYGTMVNPERDVFGCEAEAAAIARYRAELRGRGRSPQDVDNIMGRVALDGPVTLRHVRQIGALFARFGIMPSAPQAFGHSVEMHS